MKRDATFSKCGRYRYRLYREWEVKPTIMWLMLNPSTADDKVDDPTIRRCIQFSKAWGYGSLWIGNLYALRSSKPDALWQADEPRGPENASHLYWMSHQSECIVLAWGSHGGTQIPLTLAPKPFRCLGKTQNGSPKHPLYVPGDTLLKVYP